jgi:hypothetical protein
MKIQIHKLFLAVSMGILFAAVIVSADTHEDPPKEKPKKDTTKIDVEQMQEKNLNAEQQIKMLDSLIMKIDTTKKKK